MVRSVSSRSRCASPRRRRCCCSTSHWRGWGPKKRSECWGLLVALKPGHAILLVEHDMDAVFRIADRITVMVNGTVIATGEPGDIRKNADVQTAYLGEVDVSGPATIPA